MRKFLVGLLIAVVLLILTIPLIMGLIVASEFKKQINRFNYPGVKVELISYHTGWFTSQATLRVNQQLPAVLRRLPILNNKPIDHLTYLANLRIYHGPVALASTLKRHHQLFWGQGAVSGELHLTEPQLSVLTELQGLDTPARLFAILTITGNLNVSLQHDAVKYTNTDQGIMLNLGTTLSHFTIDYMTSSEVHGTFRMQGLQFAHKATEVYIAPYESSFNYHKVQTSWLGESQLKTSEIDILLEGQQVAKLFNVTLLTSKSLIDNKLSAEQILTADKVQAMNNDFSQLRYDLAVQGLNFTALSKLRKLAGNSLFLNPDDRKKAILQLLPSLLEGVEYKLNTLQAQTPVGFMQFTGFWQMPQTLNYPMADNKEIQDFFRTGEGQLNVNLPVPHDEQALIAGIISAPGPVLPAGSKMQNQQVNMLDVLLYSAYNKGYLVRQNNRLVATIKFENGILTINGKLFRSIKGKM